ncbi:hypothetical protein ACFSO0_04660 [Brevibacillus sp. GCM10020057]|uniref:hypothetical protein n=1 Tax=Brevibacillus sp. GCM10020057 TaxID=3317327 RepID=UPI00363B4BC6
MQFLKEVPLPSANLEERIMQSIYQNAAQGTPPHAAAETLQPPTPIAGSKRRAKGFPSFAWVSAAAILLAVGFAGYQQLQPGGQQMAAQLTGSAGGSANDVASFNTEIQPKTARAAAEAQNASMLKEAPLAADVTPKAAQAQTAPVPPAVQPKAVEAPVSNAGAAIAMDSPQAKKAAIESRSSRTETPASRSTATVNPPAADTQAKEAAILADTAKGKTSASLTAKESPEATDDESGHVYAALTAPDETATDTHPSANAFAGPPAPTERKDAITLSTFSDLETAVQASDLPVPVLPQTTSGFTVADVSVQYESETSTKVTQLTANYKRNNSWIKIDVVRNTHGKRSLSIPGTFTATQLFTVNGQQAIGVSFDQQDSKPSSAQHAVHLNAQVDNQSLYVVISASGISLDELIETTKLITWQ